jgi:hypothetical protein
MQGKHEVEIIVIDNNAGDGTIDSLVPFDQYIKILQYPKDRLQSHGLAFDWIIEEGHLKTEWFITVESDSFPTNDKWLDYYEDIINKGYDAAGSYLKLSGGYYLHPCGALYNKKVYEEAQQYVKNIPYKYVPNLAMKENFPCHCMIHKNIWNEFLLSPKDFIDINPSIKSADMIRQQEEYYRPCAKGVFHNGMGGLQEYLSNYGSRTTHTDPPHILLNEGHSEIIHRMGYEPGQHFSYWMIATGKKIFKVPTKEQWLPNRMNQNQEYTEMINGFRHCWGVSSYHGADIEGMKDVIEFKKNQVDELYNSLPENLKLISEHS